MPPPNMSWRGRSFGEKSKNKLLKSRQCTIKVALKGSSNQATLEHLRDCKQERKPSTSVSLDQLIWNSSKFISKFPCQNVKIENLVNQLGIPQKQLERYMHSVYPIIHHSCLGLLVNFLSHKQQHGTPPERSLYAEMNVITLVDRLLKKRPMSFLGANDRYLLPPPTRRKGAGGFESIGTVSEKFPLLLENFLSYDEMRVSALLSMSSWSHFINNGRRKNFGALDDPRTYQTEGVIVGQVGARLKKEGVMEYVDCVVTPRQNCPERGFGGSNSSHINAVWGKFWGGDLPTYKDASACLQVQRGGQQASSFEYLSVGRDNIFNITVYKKRIAITAEILLCEANTRAQACGKKAYVHVVGLGLGVWRAFAEQDELFVEAWGDALRNITDLRRIAYVDFSYINCYSIHGTKNNQKFPGTDMVIRFSKRNLHDKVPDDCILVCNYAWDGNSLPGNEFWMGKLCSTGDSAAACSSCVSEIHNHFINPVVSGIKLHVAVRDGRVLGWPDYLEYAEDEKASASDASGSKAKDALPSESQTDVASLVINQHVKKGIKRSHDSSSSLEKPTPKKVKIKR